MTDESSPEEKLLRLIKGEKPPPKTPAGGETPVSESSPKENTPFQVPPPQAKTILAVPHRLWTWSGKLHTELELLPKIFLGLSVTLAVLIAFNIINDRVQAHKKIARLWSAASHPSHVEKESPFLSIGKETGGSLPNKDLFQSMDESPSATPRATATNRVASLNSILANYTLSGIVGGNPPQAIIEDKKEGKTFFLGVGDTLGEIRIIAIEEGKVTVAVGNEQAELNL